MKLLRFSVLALLVVGPLLFSPLTVLAETSKGLTVKNGDSIAFLGDSITEQGASTPGGYVRLVVSGLQGNGITVTPDPMGVSGNTSAQMLARLQGILDLKPTFLTLSCGVNDVLHVDDGVPLDQFKENVTAIVDRAQAADVKVLVMTASMLAPDPAHEQNLKLAGYNDFLRQLAKEKHCQLADVYADMQALQATLGPGGQITKDGLHMNPTGDRMMALAVLKGFGMDDAQIQKAVAYWMAMPEVASTISINLGLTFRQYRELFEAAEKEKMYIHDYLAREVTKTMKLGSPEPAAEK